MIAFAATEVTLTHRDFTRICALAARHAGVKISAGREGLVHSRLARRLRVLGLANFADYCDRLEAGDRRELPFFVGAITTHVTSFFREQHHFDYLRQEILPEWRRRHAREPLRIFSAACSTGQEPYSIAMALHDAQYPGAPVTSRILGWDIDHASVEAARRGVYRTAALRGMSKTFVRRHFCRGTGEHRGFAKVKRHLRDDVRFDVGNIRHVGEKMGAFEIIFCRNVLIYFAPEAVAETCRRLAARLVPGGHLFLGHAETARDVEEFEIVAPTVYRKIRP